MAESIENILKNASTIAIMGCSEKQHRTSNQIASYLQENGYRIIPINPNYNEILGEKVYATLQDVPGDIEIHIADIFRDKEYTAEMVDQVIGRSKETGQKPVVWTQLDVSSEQARQKAENAGLNYIENRCIMVEHRNM